MQRALSRGAVVVCFATVFGRAGLFCWGGAAFCCFGFSRVAWRGVRVHVACVSFSRGVFVALLLRRCVCVACTGDLTPTRRCIGRDELLRYGGHQLSAAIVDRVLAVGHRIHHLAAGPRPPSGPAHLQLDR